MREVRLDGQLYGVRRGGCDRFFGAMRGPVQDWPAALVGDSGES